MHCNICVAACNGILLQHSQIKLDICMYVLVESLEKFHEILILSSMQAMYTCIMLRSV